ncbi:MAG: hypothetical protein WBU20_22565, partial [Candidatus Acidiferrum sp.]
YEAANKGKITTAADLAAVAKTRIQAHANFTTAKNCNIRSYCPNCLIPAWGYDIAQLGYLSK